MKNIDASVGRKFSGMGFMAAVVATLFLAFCVTGYIVFGTQPIRWPGMWLGTMLAASAAASWFGWAYFITGRRAHAWIVLALFSLGILEVIAGARAFLSPPAKDNYGMRGDHIFMGSLCVFPVLLSAGLAVQLLLEKPEGLRSEKVGGGE